jgi:hypothetical protein
MRVQNLDVGDVIDICVLVLANLNNKKRDRKSPSDWLLPVLDAVYSKSSSFYCIVRCKLGTIVARDLAVVVRCVFVIDPEGRRIMFSPNSFSAVTTSTHNVGRRERYAD